MKPAIEDAETVERHYRFLVRQLVLGVVGLSAFPIWLAAGAPGSFFASLTFLWLLAPLLVAALVLQSGWLELGRHLATVTLTGLVVSICAMSGGLASPLSLLFAVVPIAAAADGPGRPVGGAVRAATAGIGLLALLDLTGATSRSADLMFSVVGLIGAVLCVGAAGIWLKRQDSAPAAVEPVETRPFFRPSGTYNHWADISLADVPSGVAGVGPVGQPAMVASEGQVVALGSWRRPAVSLGVDDRFEEASAREVRNSA